MNFSIALYTLMLGVACDAFVAQMKPRSISGIRLNAARQPIMAGNWKMNPGTEEEALALAEGVAKLLGEETCALSDDEANEDTCTEVVIFPPFPFISKVKDTVEDIGLTVGAQNFFF